MRRRLRPTRFGGRIALTTVGICLGTVAVVYIYVVWIAGAGAGDGAVKREIIVGGLIAAALALVIGIYYASLAAGNVRRLQAAARKVADGNFETTIPVASVGQLAPLARTFNEMQRRLAELDSARKQFIANASHELRTPIFSLGGFVELLEEEDDLSRAEREEFVRTMRGQIERLTKLTVDLLDLSPARRGGDGDDGRRRRPGRAGARGGARVRPPCRGPRLAAAAAHRRPAGDRDGRP